jgi:hypothetical protein
VIADWELQSGYCQFLIGSSDVVLSLSTTCRFNRNGLCLDKGVCFCIQHLWSFCSGSFRSAIKGISTGFCPALVSSPSSFFGIAEIESLNGHYQLFGNISDFCETFTEASNQPVQTRSPTCQKVEMTCQVIVGRRLIREPAGNNDVAMKKICIVEPDEILACQLLNVHISMQSHPTMITRASL